PPSTQRNVPGRHSPVLLPQALPSAGSVSSTLPSQSSSLLLQISSPLFWQSVVLQSRPSSTLPSQSSSNSLHFSSSAGCPGDVILHSVPSCVALHAIAPSPRHTPFM